MKNLFLLSFILSSFSAFALVPNTKITVSGISAGAYMAQQFHTAFSAQVSGVGIIAGGPYFCAKGQMMNALNKCMKTGMGVPSKQDSIQEASKQEKAGHIDPISNMRDARIFLLSGTHDDTVVRKVVDVVVDTYRGWGVSLSNVIYENKLEVGHAFPTENFGNDCPTPAQTPYISNCARDISGEMLNHLLGRLASKRPARDARVFSFNQLFPVEGVDQSKLSMGKTGFAYIPEGCDRGDRVVCPVHVAFHGCLQTIDDVGVNFVTKAGYNNWAEGNKLIILYPQAVKTPALSNPNGCWDWFGYTGPLYHTKEGPQMKMVAKIIEALRDGKLDLRQVSFKKK
jgi:poly(3-hydroxybutyrate) depolymerase